MKTLTYPDLNTIVYVNEVDRLELFYNDKLEKERLRISVEMKVDYFNRKIMSIEITQTVYEDEENQSKFSLEKTVNDVLDWIKESSKFRLLILLDKVSLKVKASTIGFLPYDKRSIDWLDFSVRSYNCLKRDGFKRVGDLRKLTEDFLNEMVSMGDKSRKEVRDIMNELGYSFAFEGIYIGHN